MKKIKVIPVKWVKEKHDTDSDGVIDHKDCRPLNPKKHGGTTTGSRLVVYRTDYRLPTGEKLCYVLNLGRRVGLSERRKDSPIFKGTEADCNEFIVNAGQVNGEILNNYEYMSYGVK